MKDQATYETFNLLNKEFTFDVDLSTLPCGLNGAVYFSAMDATGDMGKGNNNAGAKFGTGYCDSQCPKDIKFISGVVCHILGLIASTCLTFLFQGQRCWLERYLCQLGHWLHRCLLHGDGYLGGQHDFRGLHSPPVHGYRPHGLHGHHVHVHLRPGM